MFKNSFFKKEDYTAVADFMIANLEKDLKDFTKVFQTIDDDHLEKFKQANQQLKESASLLLTRQEQKNTTQDLYIKADAFREKLLLLKAYAKRSKVETPLLQETITAIKSRNMEKVVKNTREMLPFLSQNASKIKDMPSDFLEDFSPTITEFEQKSTTQNLLISQGKQTTAEGKSLYQALYLYIKDIAEAGKIVYKNTAKKDDYIISKILKRISAASTKKEEKIKTGE